MKANDSCHNIFRQQLNCQGIAIRYSYMSEIGDFPLVMPERGISIALLPHERATWSINDGESQTTAVVPGNILPLSHHNFVWHYREKASE